MSAAAAGGAVLYVYYKVNAAQHGAWVPRVRQFQLQLAERWPGLVYELLQRPDATAGIETWMETYRRADAGAPALADAIAAAAIAAALPAPRHSECFIPLR